MRWTGVPFHLGVTSCDLESAQARLSALFAARWTTVIDDPIPGLATPAGPVSWSARRAHSLAGPVRFELFCGSPGSTWHTEADLELHHIAFWSEDLQGDVAALCDGGWEVEVGMFDGQGAPHTFVYLRHPVESRIELVPATRRPSYEQMLVDLTPGGAGD